MVVCWAACPASSAPADAHEDSHTSMPSPAAAAIRPLSRAIMCPPLGECPASSFHKYTWAERLEIDLEAGLDGVEVAWPLQVRKDVVEHGPGVGVQVPVEPSRNGMELPAIHEVGTQIQRRVTQRDFPCSESFLGTPRIEIVLRLQPGKRGGFLVVRAMFAGEKIARIRIESEKGRIALGPI